MPDLLTPLLADVAILALAGDDAVPAGHASVYRSCLAGAAARTIDTRGPDRDWRASVGLTRLLEQTERKTVLIGCLSAEWTPARAALVCERAEEGPVTALCGRRPGVAIADFADQKVMCEPIFLAVLADRLRELADDLEPASHWRSGESCLPFFAPIMPGHTAGVGLSVRLGGVALARVDAVPVHSCVPLTYNLDDKAAADAAE